MLVGLSIADKCSDLDMNLVKQVWGPTDTVIELLQQQSQQQLTLQERLRRLRMGGGRKKLEKYAQKKISESVILIGEVFVKQ
jgi:hypothetical protein